jgi:anti-sigma regulatory factor (Ser/Thr protein kinase)
MGGIMTDDVESGLRLLRRLASVMSHALTTDEVARATLTTVLRMPGVTRAGMALKTAGGRQLQFVSTDDDALQAPQVRWCLIDAFADVPLNDAVRQGRDVHLATLDELAATYPGVATRQRDLGTRSLTALSLSTEADQLGGLLVCFGTEQTFDTRQRWWLSAFAAQVSQALALRTGPAYQNQHTTAEQLQRSLMPRTLPQLDGLDLGSHYRAGGLNADVGGDWYDVIALPDGSTGLAVGDVMGKGTPAAVVMGEMRAALRAYATLEPAPSVVLDRMDGFVAAHPVPEQLVTLAYGVVSPDRSHLTLALAGHPPPLILTAGEPTRLLSDGIGTALGVGAGPWEETVVKLEPARVLLLYSNGLVESRNRELSEGVAELVGHVDGIPARRRQPRELCARVADLMTDDLADDDVTMLAVAAAPADAVRRASVHLSGETTAPGDARRFLRETLTAWGVGDECLDVAELCVSELVTNAVIHTGTLTELTAQLDEQFLTVLVRDGGGPGTVRRPQVEEDDPLVVSGRGLMLVEALTSAWAAEHGADGTTVWFELERPTS